MRRLCSLAVLVTLTTAALAADRPVAGDRLSLKDPLGKPNGRRFKFKASRDLAVDPVSGADPRIVGAIMEVIGANPGDGNTGPITLPAGLWTGLGNPQGSKGYKFKDSLFTSGLKTVVLKAGNNGGTLTISGGKDAWPYMVNQQQGAIDVRLTVGGDVYCAHFDAFDQNEPGKVKARNAAAPADCALPPPPVCGDGVAEAPEECDDGGTSDGDGCSAACVLEDASALCAGVPSVSGTGLATQLVVGGLDRPIFVTAAPLDPNRLFIVLQDGIVRILKYGVLLGTPFIDISDDVACCGEQGLLGMAFAPDYETSGIFYLSYTNGSGDSELRRYTVSGNPDVANPSGTLVLSVDQPYSNHNGGHIAFGPDGYLYWGLGDGGGGGDPDENGQDTEALLGKMLRIDVDAPTYTIPASNPFVGVPGLDEIWAYGLRNPWRWSFDRGTGDLYIADVGQNAWEEVDYQAASSSGGENYGWDIFESNACFEPDPEPACPVSPTGFTFPVVEYDHGEGCSITGGYAYRGCRMPDLAGTYFYSDYCSAFIRTLAVSGGVAANQQDRTGELAPGGGLSIGGVSSFGEDARGELYIVDHGSGADGEGEVYRVVPGS